MERFFGVSAWFPLISDRELACDLRTLTNATHLVTAPVALVTDWSSHPESESRLRNEAAAPVRTRHFATWLEHCGSQESCMVAAIAERMVRRLSRDHQRGQAMIEYALIMVLVVIVVIVILIVMGNTVNNMFCNVTGSLGSP
jgi:Flp pilus assembly pilin Flp